MALQNEIYLKYNT